MKITRLLCLALVLFGLNTKAQVTVQLGNGNNSSTTKGPWYQVQSNNRSKKVMLFTEAELAAQGILPGVVIHAMKWYKTSNGVFANGATATGTLHMRQASYPTGYGSSAYNVLDYIDSGFMQVSTVQYNTDSSNISGSDWVGFTDFYYTYTGGDLEVYVNWQTNTGTSSTTTTGSFSWRYTNMSNNMYLRYHGTPFNNSDFTVDNDRPNTLMVYTTPNCTATPVGGTAVTDAQGVLCQGESFGLWLTGNSVSTEQNYTWQWSDSANGPWTNYSVPLQQPLIGIQAPANTKWFRCRVKCGGVSAYSTAIQIMVNPSMSGGTYTINNALPTGNGNFHCFHDAIVAISCGIAGPVTLNVAAGSGPYNEQIVIPQIGGASILSTVTINGNGATISHVSSGPGERATIKLDGADYITINNLNIEVTGDTGFAYGYGVQIIHNANFNTIKNCHIKVTESAGSIGANTYAGIVINGHAEDPIGVNYSDCDINIISNNTIKGGYYGIVMMGNSEASTIMGNVLSKNKVYDQYAVGIYAGFNSTSLIDGNDIGRPDRYDDNEGDYTGIKLAGYNASMLVTNNKIHHAFQAMQGSIYSATAIAVEGCNPGEGSEVIVANNVVYEFRSRGSQYGIKASGSGYVKFQHNTLALDYEDAACAGCGVYGFYQNGDTITHLDFSNNNITLGGVAEGKLTAMHFTNGINSSTFVNNNYYLAPNLGGAGSIGSINGTDIDNIIFWKIGVMGDLLSVSIKPEWQDPTSGNMRPTNPALDNKGLQCGILFDIHGNLRNLTTPDIGAYEFDENTLGVSNTNRVAGVVGIYPNPATDVVNVNYKEQVNISISSLDGRVLLRAENVNKINTATLAAGLYIMRVTDREGVLLTTEKILKQDK